jgi:hypothetical protein
MMILVRVYVFNLTLNSFGASLATPFSQGIFFLPREISSFSFGKIKIPWQNRVVKLALIMGIFYVEGPLRLSSVV